MTIEPMAYMHSACPEKFGIPRESGLASTLLSKIVFEPRYRSREAIRGMEGFDYLWLIWEFSANRRDGGRDSENKGRTVPLTVRPPRLGGNRYMGVFATRSPFRPNPLGLSSVMVDHIDYEDNEGPAIWVRGADLMDGTPIYDIKPYISYADSHPDARCGYVDTLEERKLELELSPEAREKLAAFPEADALLEVLSLDPRPSYQDDPARVYGLSFRGRNARFTVKNGVLNLIDLE